jgi:hypothetical protein
MTQLMFVFITITIRTTATIRTIIKRKTRTRVDVRMPIGRETGELVTGRRTSPDLPRNDEVIIMTVMMIMIMTVGMSCILLNYQNNLA